MRRFSTTENKIDQHVEKNYKVTDRQTDRQTGRVGKVRHYHVYTSFVTSFYFLLGGKTKERTEKVKRLTDEGSCVVAQIGR